MVAIEQRFMVALESVIEQSLDRRILMRLADADRELRYMELWRLVGQPHKQEFKNSIERLMKHAVLNRRLIERGEKHESHLSPTERGMRIAAVWNGALKGALAAKEAQSVQEPVRKVFLGEAQTA